MSQTPLFQYVKPKLFIAHLEQNGFHPVPRFVDIIWLRSLFRGNEIEAFVGTKSKHFWSTSFD